MGGFNRERGGSRKLIDDSHPPTCFSNSKSLIYKHNTNHKQFLSLKNIKHLFWVSLLPPTVKSYTTTKSDCSIPINDRLEAWNSCCSKAITQIIKYWQTQTQTQTRACDLAWKVLHKPVNTVHRYRIQFHQLCRLVFAWFHCQKWSHIVHAPLRTTSHHPPPPHTISHHFTHLCGWF